MAAFVVLALLGVLLALLAPFGLRRLARLRRYSEWPEVRWLRPEESPLRRRVLDCRSYCKLMPGPQHQKLAERAAAARRSPPEELRGRLPEGADPAGHGVCWRFNEGELLRLRAGFPAEDIEDRWVIRHQEGRLYFLCISKGALMYVAALDEELGGGRVSRLWLRGSNAETPEQQGLAIAIVRYLIDSHLLGRTAAVPVPGELQSEPLKMALFAFSIAGRRGEYAEPFPPESPGSGASPVGRAGMN